MAFTSCCLGGKMGLLLLVILSVLVARTSASLPPCKTQCDQNFTQEDLLQHPGIATVCHRGCEIFTVALITTPIGGIPLIGLGQQNGPNIIPRVDASLVLKMKNDKVKTDGKTDPISEKALKEKQEIEKEITHRMDIIGASVTSKDMGNMESIMEKVERDREQTIERIKKYNSEHKPFKIEEFLECDEKADAKEVSGNPQKNQGFVLGLEKNSSDSEKVPIANENYDAKSKSNTNEKHISREKVKSIFHIGQISNKLSESKSSDIETTKAPGKSFPTFQGEKAKAILDQVRTLERNRHPSLIIVDKQRIPHEPVKIPVEIKSKAKSKEELMKLIKVGQTQSSSKTTVQPLPHPVQDHPVQADRQITTDSSHADDRKTTTPQTSNPVAPVNHRIQEFDVFSRLANQLGTKDKFPHPFVHLNLLKANPGFDFMMPQQISIIEIVKKKNNIDFEKLHSDHMKEAALCPKIHERFEQAKHSCRHACSTAFTEGQEEEACVTGCQIQATTSTDHVMAQTPPTTPKTDHKLQGALTLNQFSGQPGEFFSSVEKMFSSLAGKFGQSMRSMWNFVARRTAKCVPDENGFGGDEIIVPQRVPGFIDVITNKDTKSVGAPARPHLGVEIFFSGTGRKPGNHDRIINTETVFQIFEHGGHPKSEDQVLQEQLDQHNKIVNEEFQKNGILLADPFNVGHDEPKFVENELNRQLDILGEHLNEQPKPDPIEPLFFPKIFEQLLGRFHKPSEQQMIILDPNEAQKSDVKLFENINEKSPFGQFIQLNRVHPEKEKKEKLHGNMHEKLVSNQKDTKDLEEDKIATGAKEGSNVDSNTVQPQQLDLLDCISRKSGLPRWLIASTVFTSALVVFWLCFSLSAPMEENKNGKPKPTTVLVCDNRSPDDFIEADCSDKKKLLPMDDFIKIRLETV